MRPLAVAAESPAKEAARRLPFSEREAPFGYALVLPAILYLTAFIAYPFAMSIWLSMTDAQAGARKWNFIGLDNYSKVESYELVANDFVLFDGKDDEAKALLAARKHGTVATSPEGDRFKAALEVGGRSIPVVTADNEGDATYIATTILTASTPAGVLQLEAEAMPGLKPGDRTDLYFDLSRAHLFDQADECAL